MKLISIFFGLAIFSFLLYIEINSNYKESGETVFIVDLSHSMNVRDESINGIISTRLEKTKYMIKEYIENNSNGKYGMIVFSRTSNYFIPTTTDTNVFLKYLEVINTGILPSGGTNLAEGIGNYVENSSEGAIGIVFSDYGNIDDLNDQKNQIASIKNQLKEKGSRISLVRLGTIEGGIVKYPSDEIIKSNGSAVIDKLNEEYYNYLNKNLNGINYEELVKGEKINNIGNMIKGYILLILIFGIIFIILGI